MSRNENSQHEGIKLQLPRLPRRTSISTKRLSYANLVSTLALFLAVSGGMAFAAGTIRSSDIASNAVTSKQIRTGAVKSPEINAGAVTSGKVRDGSLRSRDFAPGQLPVGDRGPQGPQGVQGVPGPRGETGVPGLSGIQTIQNSGAVQPNDGGLKEFTAKCPAGKLALGGGVDIFNENIRVVASTAITRDSWIGRVKPFAGNTFGGAGPSSVVVRVICATVNPAEL